MLGWLKDMLLRLSPACECPVCHHLLVPTPHQTAMAPDTLTCDNPGCVFYLRPFRATESGLELLRLSPVPVTSRRSHAR